MRTLLLALAVVVCACVVTPARVVVARAPRVATFYETLAPHGVWIEVEAIRVWRPHRHLVGAEFVPYLTGGHWVYSRLGWSFEADWEWAWLPFHYGRWYEHDSHGWVWLPDTVWAPAWVEWRYGGDYVGWVPLAPAFHAVRPKSWCFVPTRQFAHRRVWEHRVQPEQVHEAIAVTAAAPMPPSGRAYFSGPPVEQLRAQSQVEIPEVELRPPAPVSAEAIFPRTMGAAPASSAPPRDVAARPLPPVPERAPPARFLPPRSSFDRPPQPAPERRQEQPALPALRPQPVPIPTEVPAPAEDPRKKVRKPPVPGEVVPPGGPRREPVPEPVPAPR